jgi:TatA/E family protein of Tat protein translocase
MLEGITPLHLILVLGIALIVVGPGKLPGVGKAIGESIREFRKATSDVKGAVDINPPTPVTPATGELTTPVVAPPAAAPDAGPPAV